MPFRVPGEGEYSGGDFGLLAEDEYRVKILSWEEHDNVPGPYNKEGTGKTIWFFLQPLAFAMDEEADLVDENGEALNPDKHLIFFYDPQRLGLVPRIARSRKFLAAALNVPVEEPIEFDSYDDLVGKEVVVSVVKKNGKNKIEEVRPVRQRNKRKPAPMVEAAKAVFAGDVKEEEDTEY